METLSTESGTKDFIAVGTTLNRGEDLAVKGAVGVDSLLFVEGCDEQSTDVYLRSCGGSSRPECDSETMVQITSSLPRRSQRSRYGCLRYERLPRFVHGAKGLNALHIVTPT